MGKKPYKTVKKNNNNERRSQHLGGNNNITVMSARWWTTISQPASARRRTSSRTDFTSVMMILCVMSTHDCTADGAHRSVRHPSGNWVVTTRTRLRFIILVVFYYRFFTVGIKKKKEIYRYIEASTKINNPSRGVVSRCLLYIYIYICVIHDYIIIN